MNEVRDPLPPQCPACGAAVRSEVEWCTQCYAPLRSSVAPDPRSPGLGPDESSAVGGTSAGGVAGSADRGLADAPAAGTQTPQDVDRLAAQMLARLAVEKDPVRGLAAKLEAAPGGRTGAIVLGVIGAMVVLLVVMFIAGSIF